MEEKLPEQGIPEKAGPGPPPPAPAPRDDVRVPSSLVRCPYCHADVNVERDVWVACKACLARHHATCWREGGACASCRTAEFVSMRAPEPPPPTRGSRVAPVALLAVGAALLIVPIFLGLRAAREREAARQMEAERVAIEEARRDAATKARQELRGRPFDPGANAILSRAALARGVERHKTGDLAGAFADLSHAIELDPKLELAWALRGSIRLARGEDPLPDLDAALSLDPNDASALYERVEVRLARGDAPGARIDAEKALSVNASPADHPCLVVGEAFIATDYRGFWLHFLADKVLAHDPKSALAHAMRALGHVGNVDARGDAIPSEQRGALDDATEAIELDPKLAWAWEARGEAHAANGDVLHALADLEEAAKLAPAATADGIKKRISALRATVVAPPLATRRLDFGFRARRVLASPDPGKLVVLEEGLASRIHLWDRARGEATRTVTLQKGAVDAVVDSGKVVVACHESRVLVILDAATLERTGTRELKSKDPVGPTALFAGSAPGKVGFLARDLGPPVERTIVGEIETTSGEVRVLATPSAMLVHALLAGDGLVYAQAPFADARQPGGGYSFDVPPSGAGPHAPAAGPAPQQRRHLGRGDWTHYWYGPAIRLAGDRGFAMAVGDGPDRRQAITYRFASNAIDQVWNVAGLLLAAHPAEPLLLVANTTGNPMLTKEWTVTGIQCERGRFLFRGRLAFDAPVGDAWFTGRDGTPSAQIVAGPRGDALVFQVGELWYEATLPAFEDVGDPPADAMPGSPFEFAPRVANPPGGTFRLKTAPSGMSVDAATGRITWTPAETDLGEHQVELVADRDGHETSVIVFSLRVRR